MTSSSSFAVSDSFMRQLDWNHGTKIYRQLPKIAILLQLARVAIPTPTREAVACKTSPAANVSSQLLKKRTG